MALFVKICGLRTPEGVAAAVAAGADAVGFVFAESPRRVTPAEARELCAGVPPGVVRVAVMRHPSPRAWHEVRRIFEPDWLQTDAEDFRALATGSGVTPLPVYRDTPALDTTGLSSRSMVLFEAADSGQGLTPDWERAAALGRRTRLILAGGLTPANISEAVRRVRPFGVDVSSGVESRRGHKDPELIAAFLEAARKAETDHAN